MRMTQLDTVIVHPWSIYIHLTQSSTVVVHPWSTNTFHSIQHATQSGTKQHYEYQRTQLIVPPMALTEAQVVILYFY